MSGHNSPEQFKLFMTGTEWKASITHSTDGPVASSGPHSPSVWEEKEGRSRLPAGSGHGSGVYDDMKANGFDSYKSAGSKPSTVLEDAPNGKSVRKVQSEGHHRVAAAAAIEREDPKRAIYIPTNYTDNTKAGRRDRGA